MQKIVIGVVAVISLLSLGLSLNAAGVSFGTGIATGPQHRQIEQFIAGIQVGKGTTFQELIGNNSCTLKNIDTSIAATSTGYVYCTGITGLASGDNVLAQLSTTSPTTLFGGWVITSAKASTTAGAIDMRLYNGTGAAAVPSAQQVGSSSPNIWVADL